MSNVSKVIEFITAEPNYVKEDMVAKIMSAFNTTRANAQVYIYNALRKMDAPASVKSKAKSSTASIEPKTVKTPKVKTVKAARKTEYLPGQTSGEAKGETKSESKIKSEMAEIEAGIDEFESTTNPSKAGFYRIQKSDEEIARIKEKNLSKMKKISKRIKAEQAEAREAEKQEEIERFEDEADAYVEHLKADFKRGKMSVATAY